MRTNALMRGLLFYFHSFQQLQMILETKYFQNNDVSWTFRVILYSHIMNGLQKLIL